MSGSFGGYFNAMKRLRFLRQMIADYHDIVGTVPSKRTDPMAGFKVKKERSFESSNVGGKKALPVDWVRRLVDGGILSGMRSREAEDIAIICAETGCRQNEVYNLPKEDICLTGEMPHFLIRHVATGPERREIKNNASVRAVPLLGRALEAMQRNPSGFPAYRGRGCHSATVNSYLKENGFLPLGPTGESDFYTLGGTRHTFEDRARAAKLDNEEWAFLMGHSVGRLRGWPVYGTGPELKLRALLYELTAFSTPTWMPRPQAVIWSQIDAELESMGFRTR